MLALGWCWAPFGVPPSPGPADAQFWGNSHPYLPQARVSALEPPSPPGPSPERAQEVCERIHRHRSLEEQVSGGTPRGG